MSKELIEHYLADRSRSGPEHGHTGAAGGAACGDLVRISLRIENGRVVDPAVAAEGCASARAAIAATAELVDGERLCDAALIGAAEIDAELGGLSPIGAHAAELAADALHRALGAAAGSGEPLLAPPAAGEAARVLVAVSGGVDSAAAMLLEQRAGHEVFAVTLELWSDPENDGEASCCSPQAVRVARRTAHELGVPHLTVDLKQRFREGVVEPFISGYRSGVTPNPCVLCNGQVRLEPMIDLAGRLGAEGLATGHYARLVDDGAGRLLAAAGDEAKDQTYMLAGLPTASLERMRFPLGGLRKPEVRELAREAGIGVADRAESQDLCFLAGVGKRRFLETHGGIDSGPGPILDREGRQLGSHEGAHNFTIGQRRGLGVGGRDPLFVLETSTATNTVTVGPREQLATRRVELRDVVLHREPGRAGSVRLRYRSERVPCRLVAPSAADTEDAVGAGGSAPKATLELDREVTRPAPGQAAVLLDGELVVGLGTIA